jgi:hypothetical protein
VPLRICRGASSVADLEVEAEKSGRLFSARCSRYLAQPHQSDRPRERLHSASQVQANENPANPGPESQSQARRRQASQTASQNVASQNRERPAGGSPDQGDGTRLRGEGRSRRKVATFYCEYP